MTSGDVRNTENSYLCLWNYETITKQTENL